MRFPKARVLDPQPRYTSTGRLSSYSIECFHDGLQEHRELRSSELDILENKVQALLARWDEKWQKVCARQEKEKSAVYAAKATEDAQKQIFDCEQLLVAGLASGGRVDWETLKQKKEFYWDTAQSDAILYAAKTGEPIKIKSLSRPDRPIRGESRFQPQLTWFDFLFPPLKKKKILTSHLKFEEAELAFESQVNAIEAEEKRRNQRLRNEQEAYFSEKAKYDKHRAAANEKNEELKRNWHNKEAQAIVEHAELVLNNSRYPDWHQIDFDLDYSDGEGILGINYRLPAPEDTPSIERVTYIKSRDELIERSLSESKRRKLYDSICYQVVLRSIYELFDADEPNAIDSIAFNGWVEAINPATGILHRACILSVHALKEEFICFDLSKVDPRICFKELKGVAASQLHQVAPVRPIISLQRNDSRFTESYDVAGQLNESVNLAAMDWEDFEHLVREIFEKEYNSDGAEVRVTQASRDGGVDAVVLDPDPIKGGKIVIQAKRYTATVGVSAVRDLYGTVLSEGANRGILVTTANFGPDAYKFAADKPISLLNGANLLSLLEKHGHNARIDINEARLAR